jgi:hypothetical protein
MERLRETALRPPLGDRFSVPKNAATLSEFQVPQASFMGGGSVGGPGSMAPFMPLMMGGPFFGGPPFMSYQFPWMPTGFGMPGIGLSNLAGAPSTPLGGGGAPGTGGGTSDNPNSSNYLPTWPQNNVFIAEILGWERAVPPPTSGEDPNKWIWKYKWKECQPNRIWPSHSVRDWEANPGAGVVYAYNGCEYGNYSAPPDPFNEDSRRPFVGPFGFNLETPHEGYLPFGSVESGSTPQGVQDYTLFTDFTGNGGGEWSNDLPLWSEPAGPGQSRNPNIVLGQPLPIGHHKQAWSYSSDRQTFAWVDAPNVRVLMMEQWIKVEEGGLANNPEWCPDCDATQNQTQIAFEDGNYVCTYWFYATNARLELPWVPSRGGSIELNSRLQVLAPVLVNDPVVPAYGWANP